VEIAMSKNVFANGKGISAKKDDNVSRCAMPDVCNSPPSPPAGPVPIPYPNTAKASDTSNGSKTVKIGGAEVGMKNSSNYKKSTGDEAATKTLGMNLTTHTIQGIMKHAAWSMDVKIEGANAIRHMDLTTHNHMNTSGTGSTAMNEEQEVGAGEQTICEALEEMMEEMQADEAQGSPALAAAHFQPENGPGMYMKASADMSYVDDFYRDEYQPSRPYDEGRRQRADGTPGRPPCSGIDPNERPAQTRIQDAESKILTPLMQPNPAVPDPPYQSGTVTMTVDHASDRCSPGGGGRDRMPCGSCRDAICGANNCGIKVLICVGGEDPIDPEEAGLCPPDPYNVGNREERNEFKKWDPDWEGVGMGCR
jgi:hypothetical protein